MIITDTKIRKVFNEENGRLRALISITVDNCFAIHDIKIIEGEERLFVAMPSRKDENGIFRDIVHPIDVEAREEIENKIINEYKDYLEIHKINDDFTSY